MKKSVCALGFFDGVHKAHTQLLTKCTAYAKLHGLKSVALTFETSPAEYFGKKIKYLTTFTQKKEIMLNIGIDDVFALKCDKQTLSMTAEEFVDSILVKKLDCAAVFCGFNYTFGKDGKGNSDMLIRLCKHKGIDVFVLSEMCYGGLSVSSSNIRALLENGDIESANNLLSRPFEIAGTVKSGKMLGRLLSFPTANIYLEPSLPELPHGVYATKTSVCGKEYISVSNVGTNPTVGGESLRAETYILNFDGDIYGEDIKIRFYKFLRNEKQFSSVDELKKQIEHDKNKSIEYFKGL